MKRILKIIPVFIVNLYSLFYLGLFITDYSFLFKTSLSNLTGFTALFGFLLLMLRMLDKERFSGLYLFKLAKQFSRLKDIHLLCISFLAVTLMLSLLGIARHKSFATMSWDMGIFEQALWNTLHGNLFFSSIRGNISLLGDHFQPILFFILPFYALKPSVATLLIIQAVFLGLSVFPLYLIARDRLNNRFIVFSVIISFILSKGLRGVGLSDFHPEGIIIPLCFTAFYFLIKRKNLLFILTCILLLFCKETAVFIILGFGLYSLVFLRRKVCGLSLIILALAAWAVETRLFIPYFNDFDHSYFYYQRMAFGKTYTENLRFIINDFPRFISFIFSPGKIDYLLRLTGSLGFLPFFAPSQYIMVFMPLVTILLASEKLAGYYSVNSHYVGAVLPFIYISAIYGAANAAAFLEKKTNLSQTSLFKLIGTGIILLSLLFYSKTDAYKFNKFTSGMRVNRVSEKLSWVAIIPKDATLSATSNYVPHLCHRKYIYDWRPEGGLPETEYYVIDLEFTGYLNNEAKNQIPDFLKQAHLKYKNIFSNPQGTFFIFHNPYVDMKKIEGYHGNFGI